MDRPILFSAPMVLALLDGTKTQTRRVIEPYETALHPFSGQKPVPTNLIQIKLRARLGGYIAGPTFAPRYAVGDRLYVREAWRTFPEHDAVRPSDLSQGAGILHMAGTGVEFPSDLWGKFRQGMHMPKWASRLTLEVTDVRVQRLQEISEEDAIAEGITKHGRFWGVANADWDSASTDSARDAYANLWEDLNAARGFGWDVNPWVVAVTFTVHHGNINEKGSIR